MPAPLWKLSSGVWPGMRLPSFRLGLNGLGAARGASADELSVNTCKRTISLDEPWGTVLTSL